MSVVSEQLPQDATILVTGGCGFIASHVINHLLETYPGYRIVNFDKLDYCASLRNVESAAKNPKYAFVRGDITNADLVQHVLREHGVQVIMHFAAQSHVDASFRNAIEYTQTNVIGTQVLLEAARTHAPLVKFIHASTDEVYGEVAHGAVDCGEEAILAPSNPYSATKAAAECLVKAYQKSFRLPVVITRSNNVFGPRQFPEKIVPKFICALLQGARCRLHGDGSHVRRYLYIDDVVRGFDVILHQSLPGEVYNMGVETEVSNLAVFQRLFELFRDRWPERLTSGVHAGIPWSPPPPSQRSVNLADPDAWTAFIEHTADRPFNDSRYAIDSARLREHGWVPSVSFDEGLATTVEWYMEHAWTWWDSDIQAVLLQ